MVDSGGNGTPISWWSEKCHKSAPLDDKTWWSAFMNDLPVDKTCECPPGCSFTYFSINVWLFPHWCPFKYFSPHPSPNIVSLPLRLYIWKIVRQEWQQKCHLFQSKPTLTCCWCSIAFFYALAMLRQIKDLYIVFHRILLFNFQCLSFAGNSFQVHDLSYIKILYCSTISHIKKRKLISGWQDIFSLLFIKKLDQWITGLAEEGAVSTKIIRGCMWKIYVLACLRQTKTIIKSDH